MLPFQRDFKSFNRTGSVDSRYYNRADNLATAAALNNNHQKTGYTPDFSKDKHQHNGSGSSSSNQFSKHLNGQMDSSGVNKQFQETYGIGNLNLDTMFRTNQRNEHTLATFDSVFKTNMRSENSASQQSLNHNQSNRSAQSKIF